MKQISFAILEEQDASPAACGLDWLLESNAAAGQFSACVFNGVHSHRQMPPTGQLIVACNVHTRVTRIDFDQQPVGHFNKKGWLRLAVSEHLAKAEDLQIPILQGYGVARRQTDVFDCKVHFWSPSRHRRRGRVCIRRHDDEENDYD